MTDTQRKRAKRRKKMARSVKRTVRNVLLMPGRIPPINASMVMNAVRICEIFGILFVLTLVAHLISESSIVSVINLIMGIIFFALLSFIKLADYQDRLIREEMSNYIYIR